jgi:parvulin-like peptidyl-prolyl isomerase
MVKKVATLSLLAGLVFGFPGMAGMMGGSAGMAGAPMKGLKDSTVLAVVNGKPVTVKEVNQYLQGLTADPNIKLQQIPASHVKRFVQDYVQNMILYSKAKKLVNTPPFQALEKKIAVDYWKRYLYNTIKISDKEAKEFYEKNKDLYFKSEPEVKARHILVKDEKTAEKLIQELKGLHGKALEEKFAELAKKYSIGPSRVMGGELGWFNPKQMVAPFAKAVEKLKPGEITLKPVKTRFGYHVILVEGKKNNNYKPFSEVKPLIINYLKQKKIQDIIQSAEKAAKVEYKIPPKQ